MNKTCEDFLCASQRESIFCNLVIWWCKTKTISELNFPQTHGEEGQWQSHLGITLISMLFKLNLGFCNNPRLNSKWIRLIHWIKSKIMKSTTNQALKQVITITRHIYSKNNTYVFWLIRDLLKSNSGHGIQYYLT